MILHPLTPSHYWLLVTSSNFPSLTWNRKKLAFWTSPLLSNLIGMPRMLVCISVLGISASTAKRHWAYARAWLFDALGSGGPPASS